MRSSSTNLTQKAVKGYKQNNHSDFYQLDPKIAELKKKYQLESRPQVNNNYFAHRQTSSNLRQQQVLKKLENIKSELQQIPDWQNYARSILFEGTSEANLKKTRSPIQDFTRQSNRLPSKYIPDFNFIREQNQTFQESRVLNNSNISFKINHNKSVDRPEEKPSSMNRDKGQFTPSKPDFKHNSSVNEYSKSKAYLKQNMGLKESRDGVDNKINQISRKIRQAELKKRNLGVDFIPFEDKSAYRKQDSPKHYMNENFKSKTPQYVNIKNSTSIDKLGYRPPKPPIISKFNEGAYPKQQVYQKDISPRFAQTQFNFEKQKLLIKAQNSQEIQYPISITNEKSRKNRAYSVHQNNYYRDSQYAPRNYQQRTIQVSNNLKMVQKAQEALKERKKRVENVQQKKRCKQNTKKLVQAFCEQVKLDERFRNCKLWFKAYKNDKKMNRLRSLLELEGIRISEQKLNSQFDVQQKQDNPFFSVTAQECDVQEVAKSYIECEKFWKKNLFKKFSREALEAEDFNNLSIDLDKKGYIVLEDLVRFLNMETGTFFRNRDLFTIFKRLSNNSPKVNFKDFIHNFYA